MIKSEAWYLRGGRLGVEGGPSPEHMNGKVAPKAAILCGSY